MTEVIPGNGLISSLATSVDAASTTLQIASADAPKWPSSGNYRAVICLNPNLGPYELVKIVGGQGTDTLTVERAAEPYNGDQTPRAWSAGISISAVVTQQSLEEASQNTKLYVDDKLSYYYTKTETDSKYVLYTATDPFPQYLTRARADGIYQPVGDYLTNAQADSIYPKKTDTDPYPQYLTQPEGNALYQSKGNYLTTPLAQNITFSQDALFDIGTPTSWRPRDVYIAGKTYFGTAGIPGRIIAFGSGSLSIESPTQYVYLTAGNVSHQAANAYSDSVSWFHYNTGGPAMVQVVTGSSVSMYAAPAGPDPIAWSLVFSVDNSGTFTTASGIVAASGASSLTFWAGGAARWLVDASTGNLFSAADNSSDIGASGSNRPRNLYLAGMLIGGTGAGNFQIQAAGVDLRLTSTTGNIVFSPAGMQRWRMDSATGSLIAVADNAVDIGASGANRPRNLYLAGLLNVGADATNHVIRGTFIDAGQITAGNYWRFQGSASGQQALYLLTIGVDANIGFIMRPKGSPTYLFQFQGSGGSNGWGITAAGHFVAQADNTFDIGVSGATRPRDLFLARNLAVAGNITKAGQPINPWVQMTQAAYDALGTKDPNTLYVIVG